MVSPAGAALNSFAETVNSQPTKLMTLTMDLSARVANTTTFPVSAVAGAVIAMTDLAASTLATMFPDARQSTTVVSSAPVRV